jgi:hypothetical protein
VLIPQARRSSDSSAPSELTHSSPWAPSVASLARTAAGRATAPGVGSGDAVPDTMAQLWMKVKVLNGREAVQGSAACGRRAAASEPPSVEARRLLE